MKLQKQDFLIKTMFYLMPIALYVCTAWAGTHYLQIYFTSTFTKPFLVQSGSTTGHKSRESQATTTQPSRIEYMVLKVPTAGQTAAKK